MIEDDDLSGTDDWTRPGVFRCAPDVYRIPLPLPQDGLRAVNVYAVQHGSDITVIDAGWSIPEARKLLAAGLAELGAGFPDVRRFLVTHIHRDHYTQAVALRREFGMRVALGRGEQRGLDTINDPVRPEGPRQMARLRRAGAEAMLVRLQGLQSPHLDTTEWESPDEWTKTTPRASTTDLHQQTRIVFPYVLVPWRSARFVGDSLPGAARDTKRDTPEINLRVRSAPPRPPRSSWRDRARPAPPDGPSSPSSPASR